MNWLWAICDVSAFNKHAGLLGGEKTFTPSWSSIYGLFMCRGWVRVRISPHRSDATDMVTGKPSLDLSGRKIELEFSVSHDIRRVSQDTGETLMAKLIAPYLFKWQDVEAKSDLEHYCRIVSVSVWSCKPNQPCQPLGYRRDVGVLPHFSRVVPGI